MPAWGTARESSMFFISYRTCTCVRGPCVTRKGAPLWTRKGIDTTRIGKNPARALYLTVRGPYGLFTDCLQYLNPYGARKLIMHPLKLYGPRTGAKFIRRRMGPVRAPWVDVRCLFKTARELPVRGPGVWCDASVTCDFHALISRQHSQTNWRGLYTLFLTSKSLCMQKISSVDALLTTQNVQSWSGRFGGGHIGWSQLQLTSSVSPL